MQSSYSTAQADWECSNKENNVITCQNYQKHSKGL